MTRSKFALRAGAAAVGVLAFTAFAMPAVAADGDVQGEKWSDATGPLHNGDVNHYTVALWNETSDDQNNVYLSDDPDPGLVYVPGSTYVTVAWYTLTEYAFNGGAGFTFINDPVAWDDLPDNAPDPDLGTNYISGGGQWNGIWTEVNDDGNGDTGLVLRYSEDDNNALGFTGNGATAGGVAGPGIIREFDASNAQSLRLDFQSGGDALDAGDNLGVWYSGDGVNWTVAGVVNNSNTEDQLRQFDISGVAGDDTAFIRFGVAEGVVLAANEWWSVDNVIIVGVLEHLDFYDNDPSGNNNLDDGVAGLGSYLINTADAIDLPAAVNFQSGTWYSTLWAEYDMEVDVDQVTPYNTSLYNTAFWWSDTYTTSWSQYPWSDDFAWEPELVMTITSNAPVQAGQPIVVKVTVQHGPNSDGSPVALDAWDVPPGYVAEVFTGDIGNDWLLGDGEVWEWTLTYPAQDSAGAVEFDSTFYGISVNGDQASDVEVSEDLEITVVLADTGAADASLAGIAAALVALGAAGLVVARRREA